MESKNLISGSRPKLVLSDSLSREIDIKCYKTSYMKTHMVTEFKVFGHVALSTKLCIYEFSYIFDTVLYQFVETGTSDRAGIGRDQRQHFYRL